MNIPGDDPSDLMNQLLAAGVTLRVDACKRLRMTGDPGALSAELVERVTSAKPRMIKLVRLHQCTACGSREFSDVPIHDAHSLRRDCAKCGRTAGFPRWQPEAD